MQELQEIINTNLNRKLISKEEILSSYNLKEYFTEMLYKDLKIDLDWSKVTYSTCYFILYEDRKYVSKKFLFDVLPFRYILRHQTLIEPKELFVKLIEKDIWKLKLFKANVLLENTDNFFVIKNAHIDKWKSFHDSRTDMLKAIQNKKLMQDLYEAYQEFEDYFKNKDFFINLRANIRNFVYKDDKISDIDMDSFDGCSYFIGYLQMKKPEQIWLATFKDYWDIADTFLEESQCKNYKKILIRI
jgi:hypothetical protein